MKKKNQMKIYLLAAVSSALGSPENKGALWMGNATLIIVSMYMYSL